MPRSPTSCSGRCSSRRGDLGAAYGAIGPRLAGPGAPPLVTAAFVTRAGGAGCAPRGQRDRGGPARTDGSQPPSTSRFRRARSAVTRAVSRSSSASVIPGVRRSVKTTSHASPSAITRSGHVDRLPRGRPHHVVQDAVLVLRGERQSDPALRGLDEPAVAVALDRAAQTGRPAREVLRVRGERVHLGQRAVDGHAQVPGLRSGDRATAWAPRGHPWRLTGAPSHVVRRGPDWFRSVRGRPGESQRPPPGRRRCPRSRPVAVVLGVVRASIAACTSGRRCDERHVRLEAAHPAPGRRRRPGRAGTSRCPARRRSGCRRRRRRGRPRSITYGRSVPSGRYEETCSSSAVSMRDSSCGVQLLVMPPVPVMLLSPRVRGTRSSVTALAPCGFGPARGNPWSPTSPDVP